MRIVLASGSPRRRQLLTWAGVDVDVRPPDVPEVLREGESPEDYTARLAQDKARVYTTALPVVAADTVVHLDGHILEKPTDPAHAERMLRQLSGRWHGVSTGVCVRQGDHEQVWVTTTRVRFRDLSDDEIRAYVATGDADDKAGSYGIQGRAGVFVAQVDGSWTNVMGLPVEPVLAALEQVVSLG